MRKKLNTKKIAANNPKVDLEQVHAVQENIRALRKLGVRSAEYDLQIPFTRSLMPASNEDDGGKKLSCQ